VGPTGTPTAPPTAGPTGAPTTAALTGSLTTAAPTDINECALEQDDCDANAICINRPGPDRYICQCDVSRGWVGNGRLCQPYSMPAGNTVFVEATFADLSIEEFDNATFNATFRADYIAAVAAKAGVPADDVIIHEILAGSIVVKSTVNLPNSSMASSLKVRPVVGTLGSRTVP